MNFKETIELLNSQGVTAYEIHKATGLNEAGVRRILNNEVSKPQRKTQESIVKYASTILSNTNKVIIKKKESDLSMEVKELKEQVKGLQDNFKMIWDQLLFLQNSWMQDRKERSEKKDLG